jgi:hypothetical protein
LDESSRPGPVHAGVNPVRSIRLAVDRLTSTVLYAAFCQRSDDLAKLGRALSASPRSSCSSCCQSQR